MHIDRTRIRRLAERLDEEGVVNRHRRETRSEFELVYSVSIPPSTEDLDTVFKRVIQARSQPLGQEAYEILVANIDPASVLSLDSRDEAFRRLYEQKHIGQKIANEFLRIAVDVLNVNPEWRNDLHVALDTNILQALVKTGGIQLNSSEANRSVGRLVNMDPDADPNKLIGYNDLQDAFQDAAAHIDQPRIVFDELWTEHRSFIADPLLRPQSIFADLLIEKYL
ncbi:hypothetical protein ACOZ4B_20335 (plasmid) [Haloferax prahovense]|uniref:hypothetical protein n=1 Tax=Haloferax prahovense TaxID=381852 RepID=UPI003C712E74